MVEEHRRGKKIRLFGNVGICVLFYAASHSNDCSLRYLKNREWSVIKHLT